MASISVARRRIASRERNGPVPGSDPRHRFSATDRFSQNASSWWTIADAGGERLLRAGEADRLAEDDDAAAVRRVDAAQDLAERALAGAVLAAERVARPGGDLEADVVEREHAGKPPGDVLEPDRRVQAFAMRSLQLQVRVRHVGEAPRLQLARPGAEVVLRDAHDAPSG